MNFRPQSKTTSNVVDVTPFLDTIFNLLIFFAVSLNFISNPGIKVDLPKSSAQEIPRKAKDITILITPKQELYLNEKQVQVAALPDLLKQTAKNDKTTQVLIQADQSVPHGLVVTVMDAARTVGLHKLAIITQPKEK